MLGLAVFLTDLVRRVELALTVEIPPTVGQHRNGLWAGHDRQPFVGAISAVPQLIRSIPSLVLGPGIPVRLTRQAAKVQGRRSGRTPESSAMDGNLTASAQVWR
jgi:hypothetical protein